MQIGPYIHTITKQDDILDPFCRRKLISIDKLAFPLKDAKKELNGKGKYKTLMNRTSRKAFDPTLQDFHKRNASVLEGDKITCMTAHRIKDAESPKRSQTKGVFDTLMMPRNHLSLPTKDQSSIIPIRKPSNRKDYFVFGLSERACFTENKIENYRDLLWKINYSNGLFVCTPENIQGNGYKYYVGEGNNSCLIRGVLRRRFWWTLANKNQDGINFIWTQLKVNSFFGSQQAGTCPNQQYSSSVSRSQTARTERKTSQITSIQTQVDNHKKIFGKFDLKIWKHHAQKNAKSQKKITQLTYQKRSKLYEMKKIMKIQDSRQLRMHNHLQSNFYIGNKKALFYNMKRYLELKGEDPFKTIPLTFHLSKGMEDAEYTRFIQFYEKFEEEKKVKKNFKNMWIVKPGQNTNRGNGITVCYNVDDIKIRLKGRERNGDGKLRTFILQKYLENPFLYQRRKFDIRHYMLISCVNGTFKGYWYEEGYIRTSSSQFSIKYTKDPLVHLTNDAIQKNAGDYGKYQKGNKLSYSDFQKYLDANYPKKYNFNEQILTKMKHFAAESIRATYSILDSNRRRNNFQLLGLDFMIDEDFAPWLIEINTNPCLQLCCPLLSRIIPAMIENVVKICIDPLFPPPQTWPASKKCFFGEDSLSENKFQLVFDQQSQGRQIENLYNGQQKIDKMMGKIQQDDEVFENDGDENWEANQ